MTIKARQPELDPGAATELVRKVTGDPLTVLSVRRLWGGSINRVLELRTDGEPASIVAKIAPPNQAENLRQEHDSLLYFAAHTALPVPEVLGMAEGLAGQDACVLLMARAPGVTLTDARLTKVGHHRLQLKLAEYLVELHSHTRATFGSAIDQALDGGPTNWLAIFGPNLQREFEAVRDSLSARTRGVIDDIVLNLESYLTNAPTPTLVHGDLWANNILVDDAHPDNPRITAFIDGRACFGDREQELAYLKLFHTANGPFFELYGRYHPIRSGFERRCRVYWLKSMMRHLRLFGDKYLASVEELADQFRKLD